jgi:hypothetical protein
MYKTHCSHEKKRHMQPIKQLHQSSVDDGLLGEQEELMRFFFVMAKCILEQLQCSFLLGPFHSAPMNHAKRYPPPCPPLPMFGATHSD